MSSAVRDLAEAEFLGERDEQNNPLPSRPLPEEQREAAAGKEEKWKKLYVTVKRQLNWWQQILYEIFPILLLFYIKYVFFLWISSFEDNYLKYNLYIKVTEMSLSSRTETN